MPSGNPGNPFLGRGPVLGHQCRNGEPVFVSALLAGETYLNIPDRFGVRALGDKSERESAVRGFTDFGSETVRGPW
jgi:hypothetical protein